MNGNDIIALGLGLQAPWEITGQLLDTSKSPHELRLTIAAGPGALFPCPVCGKLCHAHDFKEMSWRHLNFFQHHCIISAPVPRVRCPKHKVRQVLIPWARQGSSFTLLFEQAAMNRLDLGSLKAFSPDETKSRRGHRYVTVFIDLDRTDRPVVFAVAGKGRQTLEAFKKHLAAHGGRAEQVMEIVSDMSAAFIAGVKAHLPGRRHSLDWFHVVQLFTGAMDEGGHAEARATKLPRASRWATLKNADGPLTERQLQALAELMSMDMQTSKAWRIKEMLRWVRKATSMRGAGWRLSSFMHVALKLVGDIDLLKPVRKALKTVEQHREAILARWVSGHGQCQDRSTSWRLSGSQMQSKRL